MNRGEWGGLVWQEAALPIACYIVRNSTTRWTPQSDAGYLRTSWPLRAL